MLPQEIIRRKRDGHALSADDINGFVQGLTHGTISAEQASALTMAIFFCGMDAQETAHLTKAMAHSGIMLDWRALDLPGPALDKHSTGGIGDNISLILAPAIAACGGFVPMISGRGLGHTGGTLDKLESIPGYCATPDLARFREIVRTTGCAIIGQTADLAPADRRLYAIRDITATVESVPLITASILSKKCAAGLDGLVMDVKTGSGAFMPTIEDARSLARSIVETGNAAGLKTSAIITDMDQPLASCAGNALEVLHAIAHLTGTTCEPRVQQVVLALGAELLRLGGLCNDLSHGRAKIAAVISNGKAASHFARMVAGLGGPNDLLERPTHYLALAPVTLDVHAEQSGIVQAIDTRALGIAVVALGGGRRQASDTIDAAVGLSGIAGIGAHVDLKNVPLARVHARDEASAGAAAHAIRSAYTIGNTNAQARACVLDFIEPREGYAA